MQPILGPVDVVAPQAGSAAGRSQGLPLLPSWQSPAFPGRVSGRFRPFPGVSGGSHGIARRGLHVQTQQTHGQTARMRRIHAAEVGRFLRSSMTYYNTK